jgi:hypothetical protein
MVKYFITFAGGSENIIAAGKRLISQVKGLDIFDKTILYTHIDLENDPIFWNKHSEFIINSNKTKKRGYGSWIWKPYIIMKTMQFMKDGDILLYLDAGCEVDYNKKDIWNKKMDIVKKDLIVGCSVFRDKSWTKMDLIIYLDMLDDKYLNTPQRIASSNLFLKCEKVCSLINEWYAISCKYNLIDDSPSIAENFPEFQAHRHDQSIFSLLTKKYNIYSEHSLRDAVNITRNKTGIPTLYPIKNN